MIGEDVGDNEEGGLEHERKCLDDEPEGPGKVTVKGTRRSVPTIAEGG